MRDVYVVVPRGAEIIAVADDFDRASMAMAGLPGPGMYEIVNVDMLEEGD